MTVNICFLIFQIDMDSLEPDSAVWSRHNTGDAEGIVKLAGCETSTAGVKLSQQPTARNKHAPQNSWRLTFKPSKVKYICTN